MTVTAARSGALTLTKTASPTSVGKAGDQITYSFAVANSGNVTLTNVVVTETKFSGTGGLAAVNCPTTTLPPHLSMTCTATYTVTQADIDAGTITNTAFAGATDPAGAAVTSAASTAVVSVASAPALTLTKTASPTTVTAAGQKVTYRFLVTNTGNVTISNITVVEKSFSGSGTMSAVSCPSAILAPGASETCTATYTVTGKDMATAAITNTALATGTDPGGAVVSSGPSTAKVTVHKSGSSSGPTPPTTPPGGGSSSTPPSGPGSGGGGTTGAGGGAGGTSGGLGGGAAGNGGTGGPTATTGSDVLGLLGTAAALLIAGALVLAAARRRRGRHAE